MPKILENIRENLIKEARRQILEQGYDSFSIRSVAGACNIGTGTVYNYFSSKTALVAGVLIEDWKSSTQEISDSISSSCSMECALSSIYFELSEFSHKYSNLFSSVKNELHSPLKIIISCLEIRQQISYNPIFQINSQLNSAQRLFSPGLWKRKNFLKFSE